MKSPPRRFRSWWRRWRWRLLAVYAALLLISHLARVVSPVDEAPVDCCSVTAPAIDGDRRLDERVRIAYRDYPAETDNGALPILLLHGSPGSASDFEGIGADRSLGEHRLIAPDLPGFGYSTRDVPDYSIRAHARYAIELLDRLNAWRAHVVGFSMGGGVALHISELAPERVASITMLSSIGVQEMELLGDYHLNHAVHGLQLGFFWLLHEGLPLTPTAYSKDFGVSFSRNFYETDQRPLTDLLKRYDGPMMIVHGRKDFLVPFEAAVEHHRLVPQSELALSDYDHFIVFTRPDYIAPLIAGFVGRVEKGKAATRADADAARLAAAERPFDPKHLPKFIGVTAFVVTALLAAATLISEDLTCIAAGVMAAQGRISFALGSFACFLGIYAGDMLLFLAGRWLGRAALTRAPVKWFIKDAAVRRSSEWFTRQGIRVIFASRFLPGARLPTYFAAGALNTSFWQFSFYFFLACAVWTPILVGLAMLLGREVLESALLGGQSILVKTVVAGLLILVVVKLLFRASTARGRRLLVSTWRRMTRWEFWPLQVFYLPVVVYIVWLMLKHRSITLFTAANPAIPGGGFIGESKAEILRGLEGSRDFLPKWELIESSSDFAGRMEKAMKFMVRHGLEFPVVLKPDAGQRGSGVGIIRSEEQLEIYLRNADVDTLIQEFAGGEEFGVFYYRFPGEAKGRIFAITEKRFPSVVGDGRSTLEKLILNDDRAICMARFLLDKHADRLLDSPSENERVQLVEIGTHCRGSMFLDGAWVNTPELEDAIDRISRSFEGFYFGRFDLRAESIDEFKRGRNFKVIELNGVTSEATSIYDPGNTIFKAYRTLFDQWRIAFEIGALNRSRGVRPSSLRELMDWMTNYQERSRSHDSFNSPERRSG